jgi:hypothetical protein
MPKPTGGTAKERILARANAMGVTKSMDGGYIAETTAKERVTARARRLGEISRAEELAREMAQEEQRRSREEKTAREEQPSRGRVADIAAFGAGNYGADKRIFGEGYNYGQGLAKAGQIGLTQIAKVGSSAGAWAENMLGAFIKEGSNGVVTPDTSKWLFNRWNQAIDAEAEGVRQKYAENTARGGRAAEIAEDMGAATVAAVPQAVAAMLTGGASSVMTAEQLAAQAAASPGIVNTISAGMRTMAKDPNFQLSFAQVFGPGYEQAKADGADDFRATVYAVGNGLMNAAVEVGGGIQTLPKELQGGTSAWKAWVDSMLDEGKEEAVQGVIERAMQNAVYDKGNPLVGIGNDAIFDPAAAAEEFAGGAVVGGILSGGQIGVQHAVSSAYDAQAQKKQQRYEQAVATARERAGVKGTYQASEDGGTSYKGQAAAVDGVDKGGRIRLSSGESVDPADVRFADQDTADVYEGLINSDMTADAQTALAHAYEGGDGWNYLLGVQESYRAGRYNTDLREDGFAADLTEGQRRLAYELGAARRRADAAESRKNAAPLQSGKLVYEQGVDTSRLSKMQRTSLKLADVLSQTVGGEVHIYSSTQQTDGRRTVDQANVAAMLGDAREAPNGFYDHTTGNIYLDINAGSNGEGTMLYTLSHEYTHMIRQHAAESFNKLADYLFRQYRENGQDTEALIRAKMDDLGLEYDAAYEEVVADSMESMLTDTNAAEKIAALKKTDRTLWQKLKDLVGRLAASVRKLYADMNPNSEEGRMVRQMGDALERMSDLFAEGLSNVSAGGKGEGVSQQARVGTDSETGKPIYESNFPKGTPKAAKAQHILSLIQNVWSKKPIPLTVRNKDGSTRTIKAQFDPTYDAESGARSDASKLMGGNRHGSAAEQRVTLDLADDYYEIAAESTFNYSKKETGKSSVTHKGVNQWHYFINDILFQEYGEKESTPYRVTINVKERSDGEYVYSFSAERQNERSSTRRTLHADVTPSAESGKSNAQPSDTIIPTSDEKSNTKIAEQQRSFFAGVSQR